MSMEGRYIENAGALFLNVAGAWSAGATFADYIF
jgi:hypothetical protein